MATVQTSNRQDNIDIMKEIFPVELGLEINKTLKDKSGLTPFFQRSGRRFFEYLFNYRFHKHFFNMMDPPKATVSLMRELVNTNHYFDNELFHILFKAFVYAEARFIQNYIPQNSHEERLTGHLISEYSSALGIVKKTFQQKSLELYNENLSLDFYYADLSSNKREKTTGADFGIMFHINLPDYPTEVRTAIFQAKKFKSNAVIDIAQCNTLKNYGEEGAYYCFYDMTTEGTSSPLVLHANQISLPSDKTQKTKSYSRDEFFANWDGGIPLSIFLVFNMLSGDNKKYYKTYSNIWQAKGYFDQKENRESNPSKLLIVSVGGLTGGGQDLRELSQLYNFPNSEE